ncbi:MAG: hypothetical protein WBE37_00325 [Bryobacteraceae bacterium]
MARWGLDTLRRLLRDSSDARQFVPPRRSSGQVEWFISRSCRIGPKTSTEGDFRSIDGNDGGIYAGKLEVVSERPERELAKIAEWQVEPSTSSVGPG